MNVIKSVVVLGIILSAFSLRPTYAQAPIRGINEYTPQEQLAYFAKQYGASYEEMNRTIICESNWNPNSTGDHGLANNVTQFHKDTFVRWSKELGKNLDYTSTKDHLELMSFAFSKGIHYKRAWTCFSKIYERRT